MKYYKTENSEILFGRVPSYVEIRGNERANNIA